MSKKDSLVKKIDEVGERARFWHNAILTLLTGIAGMVFAVSQGKVIINVSIWIFGINRLEKLNGLRKKYIKELEKEI